jgi:arsenate reductase (thioredoxin)
MTVCDRANRNCPVFPGRTERIHWSFDDPAKAASDVEERRAVFRRVRDEIADRLRDFVENHSRL